MEGSADDSTVSGFGFGLLCCGSGELRGEPRFSEWVVDAYMVPVMRRVPRVWSIAL